MDKFSLIKKKIILFENILYKEIICLNIFGINVIDKDLMV